MSYPEWYRAISEPFRSAAASRTVDLLDKGLVLAIALSYVIALCWLAFSGDVRFWKCLIVPAFTFGLVSVLRSLLDRPRPYSSFDMDPILAKETTGRSFPSRHVSSAVVIACALLWLNPVAGTLALIASAVVAATRIIGGVHFPRDVVAAIVIACACALVGFVAIP